VEDRDVDVVGCEHVSVGVGDAADHAVEAQPAQVLGHLVCAVIAAEQPGDQDAQVLVGDADRVEQRVVWGDDSRSGRADA
jgi:hypothetical protein